MPPKEPRTKRARSLGGTAATDDESSHGGGAGAGFDSGDAELPAMAKQLGDLIDDIDHLYQGATATLQGSVLFAALTRFATLGFLGESQDSDFLRTDENARKALQKVVVAALLCCRV